MKIAPVVMLLVGCQAPSTAAPETTTVSAAAPPAAAPASPPPAAPRPPRLVAVGDLHGDLDNALAVLRLAGVVDEAGAWSAGALTVVQTGDTIDRGPDGKTMLELLQRLQREAAAAGGQLVPVVGNHELMNVLGDWRYVVEGDIAGFGGEEARRKAFEPDGVFGRWILENDAVVQLGDLVFAHGGVSARFAPEGANELSRMVKRAAIGAGPKDVIQDEGPLWYRGYLLAEEPIACAELDTALQAMGATRMIVGHTTQKSGKIAARCGGKLLGIDTGISDHYGGHLAALEIQGQDARALYPAGAEDLPDP